MEWVAFVVLLSFAAVLPLCWLLGNRVCQCVSPQVAQSCRRAARAYIVALFVCTWTATSTSEGGAWQIPLYASFPLVMTLSRSRVTGCVLLLDLSGALVAALTSLLISSVVWTSRGSPLGQGVLLCAMQPPVSAVASILQERNAAATTAHLLEIVIVLRVFASGAFKAESYTVWRESAFAFVAYTLGICAVTLAVLFVAPRWQCACVSHIENAEENEPRDNVDVSPVAIIVDEMSTSSASPSSTRGQEAQPKTLAKQETTDACPEADGKQHANTSLKDLLSTLPAKVEDAPSRVAQKDMPRRKSRIDFKERERRR